MILQKVLKVAKLITLHIFFAIDLKFIVTLQIVAPICDLRADESRMVRNNFVFGQELVLKRIAIHFPRFAEKLGGTSYLVIVGFIN